MKQKSQLDSCSPSCRGELGSIVALKSERAAEGGRQSCFLIPHGRRVRCQQPAQGHLAWRCGHWTVDKTSQRTSTSAAHLVTGSRSDAVGADQRHPHQPLGCPKFIATGEQKPVHRLENYFDSLTRNRGMRRGDSIAFKIRDLSSRRARSCCATIFLELTSHMPIRRPSGSAVLITPPQINKYYALDLSLRKNAWSAFLLESESNFWLSRVSERRPIATGDCTLMSRRSNEAARCRPRRDIRDRE